MASLSELQKQAKQAPKFILTAEHPKDGTIYIKHRKDTTETHLTRDIKQALKFSVGFDNEQMKRNSWSVSIGLEFSVKYL